MPFEQWPNDPPIWLNYVMCMDYLMHTRPYPSGRLGVLEAQAVIRRLPKRWDVREAARPESEGNGWLYAIYLVPLY